MLITHYSLDTLHKSRSTASRHLHRPQDCPRLIHRLLQLTLRIGIRDNASPRLQVRFLALHEQGANADSGIEISREVGVEHRSSVDAAPCRFQFLDDLHGPYLWRAAERARREASGEGVERVEILA